MKTSAMRLIFKWQKWITIELLITESVHNIRMADWLLTIFLQKYAGKTGQMNCDASSFINLLDIDAKRTEGAGACL